MDDDAYYVGKNSHTQKDYKTKLLYINLKFFFLSF